MCSRSSRQQQRRARRFSCGAGRSERVLLHQKGWVSIVETNQYQRCYNESVYQPRDVTQAALKEYSEQLEGDAVVKRHLDDLFKALLEQNLIRIIKPYSKVEVTHLAELITLDATSVEREISQMILDKKISGAAAFAFLPRWRLVLVLYNKDTISEPAWSAWCACVPNTSRVAAACTTIASAPWSRCPPPIVSALHPMGGVRVISRTSRYQHHTLALFDLTHPRAPMWFNAWQRRRGDSCASVQAFWTRGRGVSRCLKTAPRTRLTRRRSTSCRTWAPSSTPSSRARKSSLPDAAARCLWSASLATVARM